MRLAMLLRHNTTMTMGWIAEPLQMGTPGHLSHLLYWEGETKPKQKGRKMKVTIRRADSERHAVGAPLRSGSPDTYGLAADRLLIRNLWTCSTVLLSALDESA